MTLASSSRKPSSPNPVLPWEDMAARSLLVQEILQAHDDFCHLLRTPGSQASLLIRLLESGGLRALGWGNPILQSFLPAPYTGPTELGRPSGTWHLASGLPAKSPEDTRLESSYLPGAQNQDAPALSRKHLDLSEPRVWPTPAALSTSSCKKLRNTGRDISLT